MLPLFVNIIDLQCHIYRYIIHLNAKIRKIKPFYYIAGLFAERFILIIAYKILKFKKCQGMGFKCTHCTNIWLVVYNNRCTVPISVHRAASSSLLLLNMNGHNSTAHTHTHTKDSIAYNCCTQLSIEVRKKKNT